MHAASEEYRINRLRSVVLVTGQVRERGSCLMCTVYRRSGIHRLRSLERFCRRMGIDWSDWMDCSGKSDTRRGARRLMVSRGTALEVGVDIGVGVRVGFGFGFGFGFGIERTTCRRPRSLWTVKELARIRRARLGAMEPTFSGAIMGVS